MEKITDLIPIIVALAALIACARQCTYERRAHGKTTMMFGIVSSSMYVGLNSYWYYHYTVLGDTTTGPIENALWSIANVVALSGFIHMTMSRRKP